MHDLKLAALLKIRAHDTRGIRSERLKPVAEVLTANLHRVEEMARTLPAMIWRAMRMQHAWDVAVFQKSGGVHGTHAGRLEPQFTELATFVLAEFDKRERFMPDYYTKGLENGLDNMAMIAAMDPMLHVGAEGMLTVVLLHAWTAFEVLATDLWERAVNVFPHKLAQLRGLAGRIENRCMRHPAGARIVRERAEGKIASLEELLAASNGTYDLHERMGTLLKARFAFPTLHGIREAYSEAFHERTLNIDEVLSRDCLGTASLIRELILHRGSIADRGYLDAAAEMPGAPRLALGQRLEINGELAASIAEPLMKAAADLIKAVDEWVS